MDVSFLYAPLMDCLYARQCSHHDPAKCCENHKQVRGRPDCFELKKHG